MPDFSGFMNAVGSVNWGSVGLNLLLGTAIMVMAAGFAIWAYISYQNKMIFKTPVQLIQLRSNGTYKKRKGLMGGLIKQRNGVTDFVVKVPRQFRKKNLGYVPDFSLSNADDELTFITSGDNMIWQQCKETLITEKQVEIDVEKEGKIEKRTILASLIIEPIPTDVKHITINNIHQAESVLEGNKLKVATLAIGAFLLMVIVQIIFLFMTSR